MARIKFADMNIGETYECPLAVVSASARKTKVGKDYLVMSLFDGFDSITCNYWDWKAETMPQKNTVYDFKVECGEYMGNKQLTCRKVKLNTTDSLEDFMPQGKHDVAACYRKAYTLMNELTDDFYRELGVEILEQAREYLIHVPGAMNVHHNYMGGTLVHCLGVAEKAKAIAEVTPGAWVDLATIGGLFHDFGKIFTYELDGLAINITDEGQMFDHVFIGANFMSGFGPEFIHDEFDELKLQLLQHVILSHHNKKEFGSPVTPKCIEAHIVAHADALDVAAELVYVYSEKAGQTRWTEKIWALENMPHFTIQGTAALQRKQHTIGWYDIIGEINGTVQAEQTLNTQDNGSRDENESANES